MKYLQKLTLFLLPFAVVLLGCDDGGGDERTIEEIQLEKLTGTWTISEATLDGVSKKTDYNSFQLVLSGNPGATSFGYSTTGRPSNSPWPQSGTWVFGANPETQITRDASSTTDKLDVSYSVNDTQLQISFTFSGTGYPARTSVVKGQWVFTFQK